jgi:hypothetical protein
MDHDTLLGRDRDPAPPHLVVLTIGGRYGVLVLQHLQRRLLVPTAVVIEARPALRDCFHKRTTAGRVAELPLVILRSLWRRARPRLRRDLRIGAPVIVTGPLNSARMRRDIARLRPDLLVLAGIGIVSAELLAIPRLGTINVHLALLPWVRGNDVVAHSVLNGIPLGVTCHVVDRGIDTGAFLTRRLLDVSRVDQSLQALEAASVDAGAALLAEMTTRITSTGRLPASTGQGERFPLCRFLDGERRAEADSLIRAGRARALHEQWAALSTGEAGDLPSTLGAPASI